MMWRSGCNEWRTLVIQTIVDMADVVLGGLFRLHQMFNDMDKDVKMENLKEKRLQR